METAAHRRLQAIAQHLVDGRHPTSSSSWLRPNGTAAEFVQEQGYSVILPEKLQNGSWNVYRFPEHPDIATLHDNFQFAVETYGDYKYLGSRIRSDGTVGQYKWMTYSEAGVSRSAIGSGLAYHGIPKGASIGLFFINSPEWIIVDHACSAYSYISVPLYDTLGPDAVQYIVNHANVQVIFCAMQTLTSLLSFTSQIPSVRLIVLVDWFDESVSSVSSKSEVEIITYSKLHSQGHANLLPFCPSEPEDIATICYTSGTTGTPKGAVLTHANLIANVAGSSFSVKFYPSDVFISYLPLAHIYERANQIVMAHFGVAVGFYQGDIMKLMDDMAALRPTIFCSVPRLYNRICDGITNAVKASGGLRERLFNAAYSSTMDAITNGKKPSPMWDRLVFNKIRERLGGRVRFMTSGASPLSRDVMDFLRVCFGGQVIEGYGMTETSCVISVMDEGDTLTGHVGSPSPACEIKLADVPEMSYTSDDKPYPRGEICVRGPIVFRGYYKDDVQTKEVIDDDGWLHTGDIGLWLPGGRLKIIDRKKNIFKLAQGEYVAPEKIENVYANCKFVSQCFVYGDSLKDSLVAVISVDQDVLKTWAESERIKYEDLGKLCNDQRTKAAVLAEMDAIGKQAQLRGFEFVKAVTLVLEPFTLENGLLTPTFKIKRPQAKAYFTKAISDMYADPL
ncbi:long chain acyl-CoA synthetase 6, peroxisomal-like isoform X2 [Zingiber officinale]|uniref:long chain acyl-CoA synthetase 6, peroxisomal-like isoform X2 n=1 Tax=Zingiber officinale TaxID=94328 RepID=UPI001C4BD6DC|nr:long chain acyl-CoA synthetase 6, peroxisomal-like isoform X2 [Zingiber officinale]